MARRKSLLAHQARKAWAAEARKIAAQEAREAAQQRREAERAEQARVRAGEQATRQLAADQRERERQAAAQAREQQRQEADARRLAAARRMAEAEVMTEAVQAKVAAFGRLLHDRNRRHVGHSRHAEDALRTGGPEAFVDAIQRALAVSVYPDGLDGSCAAQYSPESRELWVEYDLPRQQVIPAAAGYRYVKSKDAIQAEPRKDAEIKKLYENLIARVALRTLAEAFDVAPVTLVFVK